MIFNRRKSIGKITETMRNYRTLGDVTEEYLRNHPEEVDDYVSILFEEYAQDRDTATLLSSLRIVSRVKGINIIEENSGISWKEAKKTISEDGNKKIRELACYNATYGIQDYSGNE